MAKKDNFLKEPSAKMLAKYTAALSDIYETIEVEGKRRTALHKIVNRHKIDHTIIRVLLGGLVTNSGNRTYPLYYWNGGQPNQALARSVIFSIRAERAVAKDRKRNPELFKDNDFLNPSIKNDPTPAPPKPKVEKLEDVIEQSREIESEYYEKALDKQPTTKKEFSLFWGLIKFKIKK